MKHKQGLSMPVLLEFLDPVCQCFQNPCQRAITKHVYFNEPHDLLFIVVDREHYCSMRLNDGVIMLKLVANSIPSWFSENQKMIKITLQKEQIQVFKVTGIQQYQFRKVVMSPVFARKECSAGGTYVEANAMAQLFSTSVILEEGMVQAGSGLAGLSASGSGFHQSFLMSAFGGGVKYQWMKEEEVVVAEKNLMLLKYLEQRMRLLEVVVLVDVKVETQKEFLGSYAYVFSSCELHLGQLRVDLNNNTPMTFATPHTNSCHSHEPGGGGGRVVVVIGLVVAVMGVVIAVVGVVVRVVTRVIDGGGE
nr:hypothetical protein [Tanacetum cinerariifolium]